VALTEETIGATSGRVASIELRLGTKPTGDGSEWQLHVFDAQPDAAAAASGAPPGPVVCSVPIPVVVGVGGRQCIRLVSSSSPPPPSQHASC
jgi:hypothetical protein